MSELRYEPVSRATRDELIKSLEGDDPVAAANALYAATKYDEDWKWVQDQCLTALMSTEVPVRWAAATCLGDLAFLRRPLDVELVMPALEAATNDPEIGEPATFSLSMVRQFLAAE